MGASMRNPNRRPTHPGAVLREDVMPELGVTQAVLLNLIQLERLTHYFGVDVDSCKAFHAERESL